MNDFITNNDDEEASFSSVVAIAPPDEANGGVPEYQSDWGTSESKQLLQKDIVDGRIEGWGPSQVYNDPERYDHYKYYKYENFRTNLNALRKKVVKQMDKSRKHRDSYESSTLVLPINIDGMVLRHNRFSVKWLHSMLALPDAPPLKFVLQTVYLNLTMPLLSVIISLMKKRHWKHKNSETYTERMRFIQSRIATSEEAKNNAF